MTSTPRQHADQKHRERNRFLLVGGQRRLAGKRAAVRRTERIITTHNSIVQFIREIRNLSDRMAAAYGIDWWVLLLHDQSCPTGFWNSV